MFGSAAAGFVEVGGARPHPLPAAIPPERPHRHGVWGGIALGARVGMSCGSL